MEVWQVDTLKDRRIELTAPNGKVCFRVSSDTAEMIGRMLLDEACQADEDEDSWSDWDED